ncbi:hypothetical protein [Occallatibacter riparius]|uniref:Uncharacterized protein n=1 Tax=Occallatibacter riparius TaxID=1002689 RepID=A0A9J7BPL7_9BACT|nr:hypothetical protein [Occallatibacter riparius]UWZ84473.1 hypothetical protein MOP44_00725 [Occallatibacter riparius]
MRQVRIQFAPLERAQAAGECRRRSVHFLEREPKQNVRAHALAAPARNVGITWKVILVLWLLFLAALCVRASLPAQAPASAAPDSLTSGSVRVTEIGAVPANQVPANERGAIS